MSLQRQARCCRRRERGSRLILSSSSSRQPRGHPAGRRARRRRARRQDPRQPPRLRGGRPRRPAGSARGSSRLRRSPRSLRRRRLFPRPDRLNRGRSMTAQARSGACRLRLRPCPHGHSRGRDQPTWDGARSGLCCRRDCRRWRLSLRRQSHGRPAVRRHRRHLRRLLRKARCRRRRLGRSKADAVCAAPVCRWRRLRARRPRTLRRPSRRSPRSRGALDDRYQGARRQLNRRVKSRNAQTGRGINGGWQWRYDQRRPPEASASPMRSPAAPSIPSPIFAGRCTASRTRRRAVDSPGPRRPRRPVRGPDPRRQKLLARGQGPAEVPVQAQPRGRRRGRAGRRELPGQVHRSAPSGAPRSARKPARSAQARLRWDRAQVGKAPCTIP